MTKLSFFSTAILWASKISKVGYKAGYVRFRECRQLPLLDEIEHDSENYQD